ncbi:relaxase domain-containing protein [Streptacidiphilus monticola]
MTGERAERVASSGYLGWTTLHRSAHPVDGSPGDPHLHVHVNPAHMIKCEDGRWRTPASGAVDLRRHAHLVNEIAEGLLRAKPTERHGAVFERSETGAWKLAGIPERLCAEFSRRHAQAVAMVGEGVTRDQHRATARRTAEAKEEHGTDAERLDWLTPAAEPSRAQRGRADLRPPVGVRRPSTPPSRPPSPARAAAPHRPDAVLTEADKSRLCDPGADRRAGMGSRAQRRRRTSRPCPGRGAEPLLPAAGRTRGRRHPRHPGGTPQRPGLVASR